MSLRGLPRRIAWMMLAGFVLAGCGDPVGPLKGQRSDLQRAQGLWAGSSTNTYQYTVRRLCFCVPEAVGPYSVTVFAGTVTSVVSPDDGTPVPEEYAGLFPRVEGLFSIIDDALRQGAHRVDVEYDRTTGTPVRIDIDYIEAVADDEILYESTIPEGFPIAL